MEERKGTSSVWIVVVVIIAALACCLAATLCGGLFAYLVTQPTSWSISPEFGQERSIPLPEMDEPRFRAPDELVRGALVLTVVPDSPAEQAGLRPGDVIVAVDGVPVRPPEGLSNHIRRFAPGDRIELTVQREGRERTLQVTLGRNSDRGNTPWLGIEYRDLTAMELPD